MELLNSGLPASTVPTFVSTERPRVRRKRRERGKISNNLNKWLLGGAIHGNMVCCLELFWISDGVYAQVTRVRFDGSNPAAN